MNFEEYRKLDATALSQLVRKREVSALELLNLAKQQGAKTLGGLKMLVHQAAKSFELWTGEEPPVEKLFRSLELMIKS